MGAITRMNTLVAASRTKTASLLAPIVKTQTSRFGSFALSGPIEGVQSADSIQRHTFQLPCWLEPFLWAAPKKKTSHSKKRMRASNKGLQNKENVVSCPACGNSKLLHHLCKHCYSDIKQKSKAALGETA